MALTAASTKRATSTTGDDFLTLKTTNQVHVQPTTFTDGSGSALGTATNPLWADLDVSTDVAESGIKLSASNTEFSYALPSNCRGLLFRCDSDSATVRFAWATGKVATSTSPYQTAKAGTEHYRSGMNLASKTIYFATSSTASPFVQIETWT